MRYTQPKSPHIEDHLQELIRLLLIKNNNIVNLEQIIKRLTSDINNSPVITSNRGYSQNYNDLYSLQILTNYDWTLFKQLFERNYPGFLARIRQSFPDISNAEERLLVLLKLNYNRQELSAILGVSDSTIKKGRLRLRKRLGLTPEQSLERFVQEF